MEYQYPLTILTPAYNRKHTIVKLYESLKRQSVKKFQWLVIDDGSVDGTREYFQDIAKDEEIVVEYYYKENGGKHTALNFSHPYIKGELLCIVDSDDYLVDNAVEKILTNWQNYKNNDNICGMTFLRGYDEQNAMLLNIFEELPVVSNHIDYRVNAERKGDCFEVIRSEIIKKYPFPEFENERFIGESYLWNKIGFRYDTVYINEIMYICEYLEGGLTKSGRKLRIKCPYGGMEDCKSYFEKNGKRKVKLKILIKEAWLFICYGKFAGLKMSEIVKKSEKKGLIIFNYPCGLLLYRFWKRKFKKA